LVISTPLWRRIKGRAAQEATNASALISRVLADYLSKSERNER
jgi:hypothetical protein